MDNQLYTSQYLQDCRHRGLDRLKNQFHHWVSIFLLYKPLSDTQEYHIFLHE